jgi:hypothetical protein
MMQMQLQCKRYLSECKERREMSTHCWHIITAAN